MIGWGVMSEAKMMDTAGQGGGFLGWKRYALFKAVMRAYSEHEHNRRLRRIMKR